MDGSDLILFGVDGDDLDWFEKTDSIFQFGVPFQFGMGQKQGIIIVDPESHYFWYSTIPFHDISMKS